MDKPNLRYEIVHELSKALDGLDVPPKLLGILNSWGDRVDDETVLQLLREWNEKGDIRLS